MCRHLGKDGRFLCVAARLWRHRETCHPGRTNADFAVTLAAGLGTIENLLAALAIIGATVYLLARLFACAALLFSTGQPGPGQSLPGR